MSKRHPDAPPISDPVAPPAPPAAPVAKRQPAPDGLYWVTKGGEFKLIAPEQAGHEDLVGWTLAEEV
jgi:hypothetical protein